MKNLLIIFILLLSAAPTFAQQPDQEFVKTPWKRFQPNNGPKPAFSPWEYMKKEDEFITKRAKLSMIEANSVCPLLHKMKDEQRNVDRQMRKLMEQGDNEKLSEAASSSILKKLKDLNQEKQQIENEYHRKMLKSISAKKLLLVLRADNAFERSMLRQMFMEKHKHFKQEEKKN